MGFFDRPPPVTRPERERPRRPRPAWIKPEAALPGVVAAELVLARAPDAAVAVIGLSAYPAGFEFSICAVLREDRRRPWPDWVMHHTPDEFRNEALPDEFLRVGVQFSDGRAATNAGPGPFWSLEVEPTGPLLLPDGGGGSARRHDMTYWVWPLPPPGPVTLVCEWPAFRIDESRADIDAQLILDAAARATQIWPESDDPENDQASAVAWLHESGLEP